MTINTVKEPRPYYDVVLVPTLTQVDAYRRASVGARDLFGTKVTTFAKWIEELWGLSGDGRRIATDVARAAAMERCFADDVAGDGADGAAARIDAPGFAVLACDVVKRAAGLPAFENALSACDGADVRGDGGCDAAEDFAIPAGLSSNERAFLRIVSRYKKKIASCGFVEQGDAVAHLAELDARGKLFPRGARVLLHNAAPLSWIEGAFFDTCENVQVDIVPAPGEEGVARQPDGCAVSLALPSGRYAQPALLADILRERLGDGRVAVAATDPLALYRKVSARLASEGISCGVRARVKFPATSFGRAFLSMAECVNDEASLPSVLSDALFSPFSGISRSRALSFDARVRGDRLARRDECLQMLCAESERFSQFEDLASDPEADIMLTYFEERISARSDWPEAFRREQRAATGVLREITAAARIFGLDMPATMKLLERADVSVSYVSGADDGREPQVLFTTQQDAAGFEPGSYATLVLADMNSDDFPVADKDDAAAVLLGKFGLERTDTALARARRTFRALQQVPKKMLVAERPTHDFDAEETYPCAVLQEFLDAYRAQDDEADRGILEAARAIGAEVRERGEELLFANAGALPAGAEQEAAFETDAARMGVLYLEDSPAKVLLPRSNGRGGLFVSPSPSQVETYLECPYQWFVSRRLNVSELEEDFGPLEQGSFAHAAFERFYRRFQEAGYVKVNAENLEAARSQMREVLAELREEQFGMEPGKRLVPCSEMELAEVDSFSRQIVDFLDAEAALLPGFTPRYFEFPFGVPGNSDGAMSVEYAGRQLVGTVDRIDVDDCGNAVIVDYKGSVKAQHSLAGKTAAEPGKVQTRIYAQAVKRALNLNVVGALYVSYGKQFAISGAYDPRVLESSQLAGVNPGKCATAGADPAGFDIVSFADAAAGGTGANARAGSGGVVGGGAGSVAAGDVTEFSLLTFPTMLDATEEVVRRAVDRMVAGDIEPKPADGDSCRYCPVQACPKRGA